MPSANPAATTRRGTTLPLLPLAAPKRPRQKVTLPLLPLPKAGFLAPARAGRLAKRGRELLRAGAITHRELALLDCLLWSCRRPGQDLAVASYTALCKLVHVAKDTVSQGLRKLEGLGLIERLKRRVLLSWHQGGTASRQATSCYRLVPPPESETSGQAAHPGGGSTTGTAHTESSGRTVNREIEILYHERTVNDDAEAARKALAEVRERQQAAFNAAWQARRLRR